jgi:hypothetical protein
MENKYIVIETIREENDSFAGKAVEGDILHIRGFNYVNSNNHFVCGVNSIFGINNVRKI